MRTLVLPVCLLLTTVALAQGPTKDPDVTRLLKLVAELEKVVSKAPTDEDIIDLRRRVAELQAKLERIREAKALRREMATLERLLRIEKMTPTQRRRSASKLQSEDGRLAAHVVRYKKGIRKQEHYIEAIKNRRGYFGPTRVPEALRAIREFHEKIIKAEARRKVLATEFAELVGTGRP